MMQIDCPVRAGQRPDHCAWRFSSNARMPSTKSAYVKHDARRRDIESG
jgi:hypothetical protein